ncbi:MAG: AEC family transporter [Oscillospiraceae bacterium]|nr:AEC family transporter [Oscillospiraceae bacterium]
MLQAFTGVFSLFCVMALGWLLGRAGLMTETMEEPLSRLTIQAAIPCTLFISCLRYMRADLLREVGWLLLLPLVSMLLGWALAVAAARLIRVERERRGLFCVVFALSNSIFIGLPLCQSFFGEASLAFVTMYFPCNTLVFWTLGVAALSADGRQPYRLNFQTVKRVFSPPLLAAILGTAAALAGWTPPVFLDTALGYVGGLTVPLNLLIVGAMLSRMGREMFRLGRTGLVSLAGRFLILPMLTLGLCLLARYLGLADLPEAKLMISVFTLEAAMPVMNQAVIMARVCRADHALAARLLTASCLLGFVLLPIWVWALEFVL